MPTIRHFVCLCPQPAPLPVLLLPVYPPAPPCASLCPVALCVVGILCVVLLEDAVAAAVAVALAAAKVSRCCSYMSSIRGCCECSMCCSCNIACCCVYGLFRSGILAVGQFRPLLPVRASTPAEPALPYRPRAFDWRGRGRTAPSDPAAPSAAVAAPGAAGTAGAFPTFPVAADKSDAIVTTAKVTATTAAFSSIGQVAAPLSGHLLVGIGVFPRFELYLSLLVSIYILAMYHICFDSYSCIFGLVKRFRL